MSRAKSKIYSEQYYSLTEEEIQDLIQRAKRGEGNAQVELLAIFDNFLTKYTNMLYHARYSLKDYDIRRFIALFVKDNGVRSFLKKNKLNSGGQKHVHEVMRGIQYMVQRYGDWEDIDQTVKMSFLQAIDRYKRKGDVPFSGYLYGYYLFLLKKNVDIFLIDQLGRKTFPLISDEESNSDWEESEKPPGFTAPPTPSVEELIYAEDIDEYWVAGDTAYAPFDELTMQERQLIKWRYVHGERSSEIANRITEHPNTVREHFNRIRKKLRVLIEEDMEFN
jgi:DNA-directed RNA polymerase specialized sigma24 family protein